MPPSLHSPGFLPAETLAQAIARAQQLCFDAQITISKAAAQVAKSKRGQSERRRWRAVWSARQGPDHVVACCAYCARVRTPDGEWGAIPASLSQAVHQSPVVRLSHGICPDCLARHFPR
jgi:hypothetical protein